MTLKVNTIEGRKGSACNNDAYAVVRYETNVVDIIPACEIPDKNHSDVLNAFNRALSTANSEEEFIASARSELGYDCPAAPAVK